MARLANSGSAGPREFALAGRRFHEAAVAAASLRATETARRATAAECLAWLRGRQLDRLAGCSARLERWQRTADRSDPGLNTLVALGAIAGQRPPPSLRLPPEVRALVRDAIR